MAIYDAMPEPYSGKDVGFILGRIHEGVALTGDCDGLNKDFIFPESCYPFYDENMDGVIDEDDIKVYDDGVEVTVVAFNPNSRTATLETAPAESSVMTGDCTEQMEILLAQDVEISPEYDKKEFEVLRSALKRSRFPSFSLSSKLNLLVGDFEYIKLAFEQSGIMKTEPVTVRGLVICDGRTPDEPDRVLYIPEGKMVFSPFISAKAGTDFATNSIEITADERARFVEVENFQGAYENEEEAGGMGVVLPIPRFTADVTSGASPLEVTFTNLSVGDDLTYEWDFGDGSTDSTDENPVHTFTGAGTYTVSLKATNDAGEVVFTEFNYITVTE